MRDCEASNSGRACRPSVFRRAQTGRPAKASGAANPRLLETRSGRTVPAATYSPVFPTGVAPPARSWIDGTKGGGRARRNLPKTPHAVVIRGIGTRARLLPPEKSSYERGPATCKSFAGRCISSRASPRDSRLRIAALASHPRARRSLHRGAAATAAERPRWTRVKVDMFVCVHGSQGHLLRRPAIQSRSSTATGATQRFRNRPHRRRPPRGYSPPSVC